MKPYIKNYTRHFDLSEQDFIYCENHFISHGAFVRGVDIHHITYRSHGGTDEVFNLICLCRECHNAAHNEQLDNLTEIHNKFLTDNPY